MQVCDHPALLSDRAAQGIISGASRARRQAAAHLGGGSLSGSDVEDIEDSSEEEILGSEEDEWESGGRRGEPQRATKRGVARAYMQNSQGVSQSLAGFFWLKICRRDAVSGTKGSRPSMSQLVIMWPVCLRTLRCRQRGVQQWRQRSGAPLPAGAQAAAAKAAAHGGARWEAGGGGCEWRG